MISRPLSQDLYFVGASTHPGTGVPVVVCGAKISESIDIQAPANVPRD
jgi:phytoene desaturase (3,4-didehydrolycopene-forming)